MSISFWYLSRFDWIPNNVSMINPLNTFTIRVNRKLHVHGKSLNTTISSVRESQIAISLITALKMIACSVRLIGVLLVSFKVY